MPNKVAQGQRPDKQLDPQERKHPKIVEIIRRCWATNPGDRPDFTELVTELELETEARHSIEEL